jgi:hypothetical protein
LGQNHRVSDSGVIRSRLVPNLKGCADSAGILPMRRQELAHLTMVRGAPERPPSAEHRPALIETDCGIRYRHGIESLHIRPPKHHLFVATALDF